MNGPSNGCLKIPEKTGKTLEKQGQSKEIHKEATDERKIRAGVVGEGSPALLSGLLGSLGFSKAS